MSYIESINKGISYILKSQNSDGGLAIGDIENAESGIWTSAESLDALMSINGLQLNLLTLERIIKIVLYLINNFNVDKSNDRYGYWEIDVGDGSSTLATGHAIHSLQIFLNKIVTSSNINTILIGNEKYEIQKIRETILSCIEKGTNWLIDNQQDDNGWSQSPKEYRLKSSPLCTYYVLKGLNTIGKEYSNDVCVEHACTYVKGCLETILLKSNPQRTDLSNLLYGYMCLYKSKYFSRGDEKFKNQIFKFLCKHWKKINNYVNVEIKAKTLKKYPFIYNLPYISLLAFLSSEEYLFEAKIQKLISYFIKNQAINGSWSIARVGDDGKKIKETTWVTAEVVIVLNEAQQKYIKFKENIIIPQKNQTLHLTTAILTLVCMFMFFFSALASEFVNINIVVNLIISFIGLISSIITIVGVVKNK